MAILLPAGTVAVYTLFFARFFTGLGAANIALGYSYIATVIPHEKQTTTNIVLSMMKIIGMTLGPFVNLFLSRIDATIIIGTWRIPINPFNSVGLIVGVGQVLVLLVTLIFLREPPEQAKELSERAQQAGLQEFWEAATCFDVLLPLVIVFVMNFNFQL